MGKISEFNIVLHTNRQVFYPGEQILGEVVLNLWQPMEMKALIIECQGKAYCHWSESTGTGDDRKTESFSGEEKYFEYVSYLFGSGSSSNANSHPAGRCVYQFAFTLPQNLPSSFEAFHGHIRYQLKAEIKKPWKFNHKVKLPFTVNEIVDPNQPIYIEGSGGDVHKEVGCLCCAAGPLDLNASIDRGGYCPGEVILMNAYAQNHTSRDMAALKGKLIQVVEYHATTKTRTDEKVITKLVGPPIPKREFATWASQPLGIPACPPSIFTSNIVVVKYYVKIEVDVPWGIDPSVKLSLVMGTVPFRGTYGMSQQYELPNLSNQMPESTIAFPTIAPPPPNLLGYPDMAPPSYALSIGQTETNIADDNDKHTYGNLKYTPMYTYAQPYQGTIPPEVQRNYPPPQAGSHSSPYNSQYPPPGNQPPPMQGGYPPQQPGGSQSSPYNPQYPPPGNQPPPMQGGYPLQQPGGSQSSPYNPQDPLPASQPPAMQDKYPAPQPAGSQEPPYNPQYPPTESQQETIQAPIQDPPPPYQETESYPTKN